MKKLKIPHKCSVCNCDLYLEPRNYVYIKNYVCNKCFAGKK
jgi:hypothetical protein